MPESLGARGRPERTNRWSHAAEPGHCSVCGHGTNRRQIGLCAGDVAAALTDGPLAASEAEARIRAMSAAGVSVGDAVARRIVNLAWLAAIQGRFDDARDQVAAARLADVQGGATPDVVVDDYYSARIEMLAGEWHRAKELLAETMRYGDRVWERLLRAELYASLAMCHLALGDTDSAEEAAAVAMREASASDLQTKVRAGWRCQPPSSPGAQRRRQQR